VTQEKVERPTYFSLEVSTEVAAEVWRSLKDCVDVSEKEQFLDSLAHILSSKLEDAFEIGVLLARHNFYVDENLIVGLVNADIYHTRKRVLSCMLSWWVHYHAPKPTLSVGTCVIYKGDVRVVDRYDLIRNQNQIVSIDYDRAVYVCSDGRQLLWEDTSYLVVG